MLNSYTFLNMYHTALCMLVAVLNIRTYVHTYGKVHVFTYLRTTNPSMKEDLTE